MPPQATSTPLFQELNFALIFTRGISLATWESMGTLDREIKPYQEGAKRWKTVYLFTYGLGEAKKYQHMFPVNVKIISRPFFLPSFLYSFLMPCIHFRIFKHIAVVKTNQMDGSWTAVIAKKISKAKLVVRCGYEWLEFLEMTKRSVLKRSIASVVERYAYAHADKIMLTSYSAKDFVERRFSVPESKIAIIPNYIDTEKFAPSVTYRQPGRVIFVGRLEKEKNLDNLILAVSGLSAELVLVGEGSLHSELQRIAAKENVRVTFLGAIPQARVIEELNKSEVFVLPSLYEGNPKALLEAMSCKLPCIGSKISGIESILKDKENGLLSGTDADSIKQALKLLLADGKLRIHVEEGARSTIMDVFSFEKVFSKEMALYENLLKL